MSTLQTLPAMGCRLDVPFEVPTSPPSLNDVQSITSTWRDWLTEGEIKFQHNGGDVKAGEVELMAISD
jgi:hypothetical protein